MALRLPQPCRPETGPPNPALLPPTLPSVRPPKCCDCHSSDPADGVRAFLLGSAQDRGAGRPGAQGWEGGTVGPCLCLAEFPTSHVEVGG